MKTSETKLYRLKMSLTGNGKWKAVPYKDIMYLNASNNYNRVFIRDTNIIYHTSFSLSQLEKMLPSIFFRCHRSVIINLAYVGTINKFQRFIVTSAGEKLPVARERMHLLLSKLHALDRISVPFCEHCEHCNLSENCRTIRPFMIF